LLGVVMNGTTSCTILLVIDLHCSWVSSVEFLEARLHHWEWHKGPSPKMWHLLLEIELFRCLLLCDRLWTLPCEAGNRRHSGTCWLLPFLMHPWQRRQHREGD
jgi:hypothetical protein